MLLGLLCCEMSFPASSCSSPSSLGSPRAPQDLPKSHSSPSTEVWDHPLLPRDGPWVWVGSQHRHPGVPRRNSHDRGCLLPLKGKNMLLIHVILLKIPDVLPRLSSCALMTAEERRLYHNG